MLRLLQLQLLVATPLLIAHRALAAAAVEPATNDALWFDLESHTPRPDAQQKTRTAALAVRAVAHGQGLFLAAGELAAGDLVGCYTGAFIANSVEEEARHRGERWKAYIYSWNATHLISPTDERGVVLPGHPMAFVNEPTHPAAANLDARLPAGSCVDSAVRGGTPFFATRTIAAGEELTLCYGSEYAHRGGYKTVCSDAAVYELTAGGGSTSEALLKRWAAAASGGGGGEKKVRKCKEIPLCAAASAGDMDALLPALVDALQTSCVAEADTGGWTALHRAAKAGHADVASSLLPVWPKPAMESRTEWGTTALMLAASAGHSDVVALLLEQGADAAATSDSGKTALQMARKKGHAAVIALLQGHEDLRRRRRLGAKLDDEAAASVVGWDRHWLLKLRAEVGGSGIRASLKQSLHRMRRDAVAALAQEPPSVVSAASAPVPGSGIDKHDLWGIATYAWPCGTFCKPTFCRPARAACCDNWWESPYYKPSGPCDNATGLPWERHDGYHNVTDADMGASDAMSDAVTNLALASYLLSNSTFGAKAARLLQVWFLDSETSMNPNLDHTAILPGVNRTPGGRTPDGSCIVTSHRWNSRLTDSMALLHSTGALTAEVSKQLDYWNAKYLHWWVTSPTGRKEANMKQNHATWHTAEAAALAYSTNDTAAAAARLARFTNGSVRPALGHQILPSGQMPFETARSDSIGYSCMNLAGLFKLATIGRSLKPPASPDLFTYVNTSGGGSGSIRQALDYLLPFATNASNPWLFGCTGASCTAWTELAPQMLIAARVYNEPRYERMIELLPWGHAKNHHWPQQKSWDVDVSRLLFPSVADRDEPPSSTDGRLKTDDASVLGGVLAQLNIAAPASTVGAAEAEAQLAPPPQPEPHPSPMPQAIPRTFGGTLPCAPLSPGETVSIYNHTMESSSFLGSLSTCGLSAAAARCARMLTVSRSTRSSSTAKRPRASTSACAWPPVSFLTR